MKKPYVMYEYTYDEKRYRIVAIKDTRKHLPYAFEHRTEDRMGVEKWDRIYPSWIDADPTVVNSIRGLLETLDKGLSSCCKPETQMEFPIIG